MSLVIPNEHEMGRIQDSAKPLAVLAADARLKANECRSPPLLLLLFQEPHEWRDFYLESHILVNTGNRDLSKC